MLLASHCSWNCRLLLSFAETPKPLSDRRLYDTLLSKFAQPNVATVLHCLCEQVVALGMSPTACPWAHSTRKCDLSALLVLMQIRRTSKHHRIPPTYQSLPQPMNRPLVTLLSLRLRPQPSQRPTMTPRKKTRRTTRTIPRNNSKRSSPA